MKMNDKLIAETERVCACLAPHVRKACDSSPSPAVLTAIHAAAEQRVRRNRLLPFVRFAAAAAAMLIVSLTGWVLIRSSLTATNARQTALLDDMLALCDENTAEPEFEPKVNRENLARRLLSLQGLDESVTLPEEPPAEPPPPPSTESQSRNMTGLPAQICV